MKVCVNNRSLAWLTGLTMIALMIPAASATPMLPRALGSSALSSESVAAVPAGATLDCDDESGDSGDPEVDDRETNLSGEAETYTCAVTAPDGADEGAERDPVSDVSIDSEHQGPNDPDNRGFGNGNNPTADYDDACTTDVGGTCTFVLEPLEAQFGAAFVCFWVDDDADDQYQDSVDIIDGGDCDSSENTTEAENNDLTDKVNKIWLPQVAEVDAQPKTDTNPSGTSHTVTALATDEAGDPAENELVDFEVEGPRNDLGVVCNDVATDAEGTASCTYDDSGDPEVGGNDTIRVYVQGQRDGAEVPADDDGDTTDVVTKSWAAVTPVVECGDGVDNDGDGRTDFGDDPGCDSPDDDDESDGCDINGTSEADVLVGTDAGEIICGRGGGDTITGNGGIDTIRGGLGADAIGGGTGGDTISGGSGKDSLRGGRGPDRVVGGPGNDILSGGDGSDSIDGNAGNDFLNGGKGTDSCSGGPGKNRRRRCE